MQSVFAFEISGYLQRIVFNSTLLFLTSITHLIALISTAFALSLYHILRHRPAFGLFLCKKKIIIFWLKKHSFNSYWFAWSHVVGHP